MRKILRRTTIAFAGALCVAAALPAFAQTADASATNFPSKVVRIVVPFSPGGSADASARILGERLAEIWDKPVIIENKPGAGTTVASAHVAQSPPDGHTLYLAYVLSYATSANLYSQLPYDPATDLAPVSLIADAPFVLSVSPTLKVSSVSELVELAKSSPQPLTYASTGNGAGPHLTTEMFLRRANIKATHVPFRGTSGALTSLMGDQVHFSVFDAAALGQLRSGRVKPIAVTSAKRWPQLPDVPTIAESGFAGFDVSSGAGIMVSGKTPPELVDKLHSAIVRAMATPAVQQKFSAQGFVPLSSSPSEFKQALTAQMERMRTLIKEIGLKVD
ncbi:tripartite tricarboxylate transporter substrate binding protein [Ramlibacter sp. AN1015]|uniref:Bug family tripartite tricarboxylate transporter substrate binding protein n=1 Tax=Ramlibacter sp. AN1015 TaxID=3133428 RepID=UPI0030C5DBA7